MLAALLNAPRIGKDLLLVPSIRRKYFDNLRPALGKGSSLIKDKGVLSSPELLLVLNRVNERSKAEEAAERVGIKLAAFIPEDPLVGEMDAKAAPLAGMPSDAPSMKAVIELSEMLFSTDGGG